MRAWIIRHSEKYTSKLAMKMLANCANVMGVRFDADSVRRGEFGKPYCSDFYFNLSHSGNYVAVAIAQSEVGVDIEVKREIKPRMARKILHPDDERGDLLDMWVLKEAYSKYLGKGITLDFTSFSRREVEEKLRVCNLSTDEYCCYLIGERAERFEGVDCLDFSEQ